MDLLILGWLGTESEDPVLTSSCRAPQFFGLSFKCDSRKRTNLCHTLATKSPTSLVEVSHSTGGVYAAIALVGHYQSTLV